MDNNETERDIFEVDGVKVAVSRALHLTMTTEEVSALVARVAKNRADPKEAAEREAARKTLIDRYGAERFRGSK